MASWAIPVSSQPEHYQQWSSRKYAVNLPEKWSEKLGHYLGWLVGDGAMTDQAAVTVYGTTEEQRTVMLIHRELLAELNGGKAPKPVEMANGTYQLRVTRGAIRHFFQALGIKAVKAGEKRVPWSIFEAPKPIVAAFLRGLYDADGCVNHGATTRYAGLASASIDLLRDVQQLLDSFGVHGSIYSNTRTRTEQFSYTTKDGEHRTYSSTSTRNDLRVMGSDLERFSASIGFELAIKADALDQMLIETTRYATKHVVRLKERSEDGWETTYNLTEPKNHSYLAGGVLVSNCSEYLFLDDTACNLASLNLVKFEQPDGGFDIEGYRHAIRLWTIVLEISVSMAHFPSPEIAQGSYDYRTLGLGYANLGSLLMRQGIAYDSDQGRTIAGALTAILTGQAYATSAEMASVVGTFPRYSENTDSMLRVMRNHRRAAYNDPDYEDVSHKVIGIDATLAPDDLLSAARDAWDQALTLGEEHGYRNAQASVLAPTGCLVGGSLVPTERGLVRLRSLGNPEGPQWQNLGLGVGTDEGRRTASHFYVNGVEPVVSVDTARGYRIKGTTTHRIKVVDQDGTWQWKRLADLAENDLVPLQLEQLVGASQTVTLPPLGEMHWTGDFSTRVPRTMSPDLAEFVGYFMGDGSLHSKGIRLAVAAEDFDVVERFRSLGKELFGIEAHITDQTGYTEVALHSVPLTIWWEACGFAKHAPVEGHTGKGWHPHIPDAVLASNDPEVYGAFLRGLFEADGTVHRGHASWSTTSLEFSLDVQNLLLALGIPTTRKFDAPGWGSNPLAVLRTLNLSYGERFAEMIGFISDRKRAANRATRTRQASRGDYVPVTRQMVDRLAPENDRIRKTMLMALNRRGLVSRRSAEELYETTHDEELGHLLSFYYDRVASAELGEEEFTYDLSVPDNVTYVANGFVSHNTIGLLMDCDTTGVEPDFSLVKFKKLAGGGYFKIANQSVAPALRHLGYEEDQITDIVTYIVGTSSLANAPHINRVSLEEKGFTPEEIDKFQAALPSVFELRHAFNVFTVGEEALQRIGLTPDDYTAWDFDLLSTLGFSKRQVQEANDHICGRQTIEGAPHLRDEHLPVFDTANRNGRYGQRFIHHTGHIKMMAAAQPFISGAISKTINMPSEVTPEDIEDAYRMSWELGLKAMALYRDGSKAAQPLNSKSDDGVSDEEDEAVTQAMEAEAKIHWGNIPAGLSPTQAYASGMKPPRFLLPARRNGYNQEARVGGHKVFLRTGEYEDGTLGEIFIDLAKEGATLKGILSCFAIAVSKGLQYGVPLDEFVDTFTFQTFEPRGMVEGHPNIKMANSIIDYVFRSLGVEYLYRDELAQVPPNRDMELPEPKKGLAAEAGQQLELDDAMADSDVDAVQAAARFADSPATSAQVPQAQKTTVRVDAGTMSMQSALGEMMGDAPLCDTCGHITVRNGSCYKCLNCGNSLGCS